MTGARDGGRFARGLRRVGRRLERLRPGPVILMYHRVAEPEHDPWELAVSPAHFEEQAQVLACRRRVLAMPDFVAGLQAGTLPRDAAAVTFDDGYVDNLRAASPTLARHGLPATVFVAAGWTGRKAPFWWDELTGMLLGDAPVAAVEVALADGPADWPALETDADGRGWRGWDEARTPRQRLFLDLWARLQRMDEAARERSLATLRAVLPGKPGDHGRAMTATEVAELVKGPCKLGGHTLTHPLLSSLEGEALAREVAGGRAACEALAGTPAAGFAYPYGDHHPASVQAVRAAGFDWACTTRADRVRSGAHIYELPRVQAPDLGGEAFERALRTA